MSPVYLHVSNFKDSHSNHYALNAGQSIVKKRTRLLEANPKHIGCWMNHSIMQNRLAESKDQFCLQVI